MGPKVDYIERAVARRAGKCELQVVCELGGQHEHGEIKRKRSWFYPVIEFTVAGEQSCAFAFEDREAGRIVVVGQINKALGDILAEISEKR